VAAGRRRGLTAEPSTPTALLQVLARALDLDRAVLLVQEAGGETLVPVARIGAVRLAPVAPGTSPGGGPWTAELPVVVDDAPIGLLCVARRDGARLAAADRTLAARVAESAGQLVWHQRASADLARSRELLARADRLAALGTLAASVAHEIRNPLVSVRTFIQLLPERLADEEFRTNFRDLALGEVERICALINDLLAFSRPAPAQYEPTDLNELVGQIVRLLDAEARRQDVELAATVDAELPLVPVDDAQVKQVLMNVVLNAIQASHPRGRVEVTTGAEAEWCVVSVVDSGAGIPPENAERIFEPFFSTKETGSGLGLFIARQIVAQHGGEIRADRRPEGGSVFSIRLPLEARTEDAGAGAV
jgi:signal transduction histidine kinase